MLSNFAIGFEQSILNQGKDDHSARKGQGHQAGQYLSEEGRVGVLPLGCLLHDDTSRNLARLFRYARSNWNLW
jgi:hypothetical protein